MKNSNIENTGKFFFWSSFILGNICLFGYIITKNLDFAYSGFLLITLGAMVNLLVVIGLLIYGGFNKQHLDSCVKSVGLMLINIPFAILYAFIGINII